MSSQPQQATYPGGERGWTAEDRAALDELFARLYNRIRTLASRIRWSGSNPTLNPTALVHEAYMKLRKDPSALAAKSCDEAISIFANAMRQILIDGARRRNAQKRLMADLPERTDLPIDEALTLDAALADLERENSLQARIVQCRFLLGMTVSEAALALGTSQRSIEREWQEAKARLSRTIRGTPEGGQ